MVVIQFLISIISILYVIFLPGFFLSYLFFKPKQLDAIERLVYSFAFSIAIVPLCIFYSNLFGIPINAVTVILHISLIIFCIGIALGIQLLMNKR